MDTVYEDRFVVYLLEDLSSRASPEMVEQEVVSCSSYEEARRIRREYHASARECVIRYQGSTGGGD